MGRWEFLRWRRTLRYAQLETAEKLGVSRSTIRNWEYGLTPIPLVVELACLELTRRWKQRPEFGPVSLVFTEGLGSSRTTRLQCALFSNNDAAIKEAIKLLESVMLPMIMEDGGGVVWTASELLSECQKRKDEAKARPAGEQTPPTSTKPR